MKAEQITQALAQKFRDEDARIVFWRDESAEFEDYMSGGLPEELADIVVLNVSRGGALSAKIRIESAEPDERFLVYRGGASPSPEADWLLDIRCYSAELHADIASVWLQELGLAGLRMRDHLRLREMFLKNQERRRKLAKHLVPDDTEAAIDRKMLAVLANSETDTAFAILCAVCQGHPETGRFDLAASPPAIDAMEKMGLATVFWDLMAKTFGYAVANPSISGLLRGLFISDLFRQLQGGRLDQVAHFELPRAGRQKCRCLSNPLARLGFTCRELRCNWRGAGGRTQSARVAGEPR
ncbi:MAG: hypothetical protein IPG61_09725 [bacterium]|nr:hypothetical protein [bacterium]